MFFWRLSTFMESLRSVQPEMANATEKIADLLRDPADRSAEIQETFETLPDISIDYALMEKAKNVCMTVGDFPWDDVGSWDSLTRTHPVDDHSCITIGDPIMVDCENVIVYNEPKAANMAVGVVGMKNVIIVTSPDGILVCAADQAQNVKRVVSELKVKNAAQL